MSQQTDRTVVLPKRAPGLNEQASSALERYQRAVNYLAAAQIYLKANPLLEEPLRPEHIKERLLGHWGTCPGINLVYSHLNRLILRMDASILLITGPGHGAVANLANLYLEGSLTEFYPELTRDRAGLQRFIQGFSWPDGFPSHLSPTLPGVIHEGGEVALLVKNGAASVPPVKNLISVAPWEARAVRGMTCIIRWDGSSARGKVRCHFFRFRRLPKMNSLLMSHVAIMKYAVKRGERFSLYRYIFTRGGNLVSHQTVFDAILALSENERIQLLERLLESLGPETDGVDEATFIGELHRRSAEIDQGKAELVPWSELKNEPF